MEFFKTRSEEQKISAEPGVRRCPVRSLLGAVKRAYLPALALVIVTSCVPPVPEQTRELKPMPEFPCISVPPKIYEEIKGIPESVGVDGLIIGNGGANIRRAPSSLYDTDIVGQLEPDTLLRRAYLVIGNDPTNPYDAQKSPRWYFVPQNEGRDCGLFIWAGNVNPPRSSQ